MAWLPISGTIPQYSTINNALAADYYLKFYESGTTTPINMATDSTGGTLLAKCALSDQGYPITNPIDDSTRFIPHIDQDYRIVLFKSEADADANDTSNADFNIDGMALQVAPSADASDITLRDTTVEIQDDYDRSPLFIDTDGFTAGAGPHVITVSTAWTPTNADMRFYKVDASGIVVPLTPTSTSATTFTLAETLLSTDVIFIGDDTFRSIFEGDPKANFEAIKQDATDSVKGVSRLNNTLTSTDTGAASTAAQAKILKDAIDANTALIPYYNSATLATNGSLTSGDCKVVRVGDAVTISGGFGHSSASSVSSGLGYLPAWATPTANIHAIYDMDGFSIKLVFCNSTGAVGFNYRDWTGVLYSRTSSAEFTVSYTV